MPYLLGREPHVFCLFTAAWIGPLASSVTSTVHREGLRELLPFLLMRSTGSSLLKTRVYLHSRKSLLTQNEIYCPFKEPPSTSHSQLVSVHTSWQSPEILMEQVPRNFSRHSVARRLRDLRFTSCGGNSHCNPKNLHSEGRYSRNPCFSLQGKLEEKSYRLAAH